MNMSHCSHMIIYKHPWIPVYIWLGTFTVHLKLSQHCLVTGYTPIHSKKFKKMKNNSWYPGVPENLVQQSLSNICILCYSACIRRLNQSPSPSLSPLISRIQHVISKLALWFIIYKQWFFFKKHKILPLEYSMMFWIEYD